MTRKKKELDKGKGEELENRKMNQVRVKVEWTMNDEEGEIADQRWTKNDEGKTKLKKKKVYKQERQRITMKKKELDKDTIRREKGKQGI